MMKKPAVWITIAMFLLACSGCAGLARQQALKQDPQYAEGYSFGKDKAAEDRVKLDCSDTRLGVQGSLKAQAYANGLKEEGKSEAFISGFYQGYKRGYNDNIERMCD